MYGEMFGDNEAWPVHDGLGMHMHCLTCCLAKTPALNLIPVDVVPFVYVCLIFYQKLMTYAASIDIRERNPLWSFFGKVGKFSWSGRMHFILSSSIICTTFTKW